MQSGIGRDMQMTGDFNLPLSVKIDKVDKNKILLIYGELYTLITEKTPSQIYMEYLKTITY